MDQSDDRIFAPSAEDDLVMPSSKAPPIHRSQLIRRTSSWIDFLWTRQRWPAQLRHGHCRAQPLGSGVLRYGADRHRRSRMDDEPLVIRRDITVAQRSSCSSHVL